MWLGGTDGSDETWRWDLNNVVMTYNGYASPEPNNGLGQHCLAVHSPAGEWNDMPCSYAAWFICEYP